MNKRKVGAGREGGNKLAGERVKKKGKDKEVARKQVGLKALSQLKHAFNPHFKII